MALATGSRLGAYRIVALLGAGGMGEVYRAHDAKLNRDVALKVLLPKVANDPDRLARFRREAQILGSLNHPNIAHIYGLEESDGVVALVLELVEGETLADRIARDAIPLEDALPIAQQIAEALEGAHEQGIIHRDLKPANIKVRDDGTVKVLDFGLAKALEPVTSGDLTAALTNSPTMTSPALMTGVGVLLGTAAYMSPEQTKGRPADKRSDIWAFGCVLFEMLTGKRAFDGEDVADTIAAIRKGAPEWIALPPNMPALTRTLLEQCLERDRHRRLGDISAVRFALHSLRTGPASSAAGPTPVSAVRLWLFGTVAALALVAATVWLAWHLLPLPLPTHAAKFSITLPNGQSWPINGGHLVAISPDGGYIVYVSNQQLYLRALTEMNARPIQGTALGAEAPFFSPDGQWIGFYAAVDRKIKRVAVTGGTPVTVCDADVLYGASWAPNDQIFFGQYSNPERRGIFRVAAAGGKPERVFTPKPTEQKPEGSVSELAASPQLLPSGQLLFTVAPTRSSGGWDHARIVAQSPGSREQKVIIDGGSDAHYLSAGYLTYAVGSTIMAVAVDLKNLRVRGSPIPVIEDVRRAPDGTTGAAQYSVSDDGTLVYVPGRPASSRVTLALVDRAGKKTPLALPAAQYANPRISPNGHKLAFHSEEEQAIWVYDLTEGAPVHRLTFEGHATRPTWTSDGHRLIFRSDREGDGGLFWQPADGGESATRLVRADPGTTLQPEATSPDGKVLIVSLGRGADRRLVTVGLEGDHTPKPLLPPYTSNSSLSPDAKWLTYYSNNSGHDVVYVQPFPPTGAQYQISQDARDPLWSPNGQELFYLQRKGTATWQLVSVPIHTKPAFTFGAATILPISEVYGAGPRAFDVLPDNTGFVVMFTGGERSENQPLDSLNVTLSWFEELNRRINAK